MHGQKRLWFGSTALFLALVVALTGCQQSGAPSGEEAASGEAGQPPDASSPAPSGQSAASTPQASQPSAPPRSITLDAGTALKARTTTTISTKSHKAGDTFAGSHHRRTR
jgi:hypothetical protein